LSHLIFTRKTFTEKVSVFLLKMKLKIDWMKIATDPLDKNKSDEGKGSNRKRLQVYLLQPFRLACFVEIGLNLFDIFLLT